MQHISKCLWHEDQRRGWHNYRTDAVDTAPSFAVLHPNPTLSLTMVPAKINTYRHIKVGYLHSTMIKPDVEAFDGLG